MQKRKTPTDQAIASTHTGWSVNPGDKVCLLTTGQPFVAVRREKNIIVVEQFRPGFDSPCGRVNGMTVTKRIPAPALGLT